MHILASVRRANEVPLLFRAGADWLYTELVPWWNGKTKRVPPPTHSLAALFSPTRIEELAEIVENAHHAGALLLLKLGAAYYAAETQQRLPSLLDQALEVGVDGFIFSDLGVLPLLTELKGDSLLIVGPEAPLSNAQSLLLMARIGANHVVLAPRLSLSEMNQMVTQGPSQLNYGCLIFNGPFGHCFYDPALCNTVHAGKNFCDWDLEWQATITYTTDGPDVDYSQSRQLRENEYWQRLWLNPFSYFAAHVEDWRNSGCGLCALPSLAAGGKISFLQVSGEHHEFPRRLKAVALVRRACDLVAQGAGSAQVREVFSASQPNAELCDLGYRCLYPDAVDRKFTTL